MEDAQALRPTLFIAVPRILSRVADGVKHKMEKASGLQRVRKFVQFYAALAMARTASWGQG